MSTTAWQTTAADLVAHRSKPTCPKPPNSDPEALEEDASGEREATELRSYWRSPTEDALQRQSHVTVPSLNGDLTRRPHATQTQGSSYGTGLKKFWNRQIAMTVPHIACRDHLALERTYLGYLRTSLGLAVLGVVVAQLFRLQHVANPNSKFGFYVLGKPIAGLFIATAILVILLGAFRFWRQQNAIVRNKIHAAGWEVYTTGTAILSLLVLVLATVIAVEVERDIS